MNSRQGWMNIEIVVVSNDYADSFPVIRNAPFTPKCVTNLPPRTVSCKPVEQFLGHCIEVGDMCRTSNIYKTS